MNQQVACHTLSEYQTTKEQLSVADYALRIEFHIQVYIQIVHHYPRRRHQLHCVGLMGDGDMETHGNNTRVV